MGDIIQTFFEQLSTRGYQPLLHRASGTLRFDIEGRRSWELVVRDGSISLARDLPRVDCVITCTQELFVRIVQGEQNPTTAFMQGKLEVTGDLGLAQLFQRLVRIRPETSLFTRRNDG